MTPEAWGANVGALLAAGVAAWQAWTAKREARRGRERTDQTVQQVVKTSRQVAEVKALAEPVGNGFRDELYRRVDAIADTVDGIAQAVEVQGERLARVEANQELADAAHLRHLELHAQQPR